MAKEVITPEPIMQTVAGLWAAGVLKSGLDLRVFDYTLSLHDALPIYRKSVV